jgi:putative transposase
MRLGRRDVMLRTPRPARRRAPTVSFAKTRSTREIFDVSLVRTASLELIDRRVLSLLITVLAAARSALRTRGALALENLALRQQLAVLQRRRPRPPLDWTDRLFWVALSRAWSRWRDVLIIVKPATVVRWHRSAYRRVWMWRSRRAPGRPPVDHRTHDLVRQLAQANALWGAPRIHGELLKLGVGISERAVSRLMPRVPRKPPSQTWRTFLTNHVGTLASIDFFTVPTATFRVLYVFVVLAHDRRRVLHFNVTQNPTAAWTAQQIVEAFPEASAPKYLMRDRDQIYGATFRDRLAGMGIEEILSAPRAPWQNPFVERLIGSVRRECLDHAIVLGERHLRRILASYFAYYHRSRTHLSLGKDPPASRAVMLPETGEVVELPEVGGLHHRYERRAA